MGRSRRQKNRRARLSRAAVRSRRIEVVVEELELVRAHDGAFRGAVEPRLLAALYHVRPGRAALLTRSVLAVDVRSNSSARLELERELLRASWHSASSTDSGVFVLVAVAVEEDSGHDVQTLSADLEHPELWAIWDSKHAVPEPATLDELALGAPSEGPNAERIELVRRGSPMESTLRSDELVGAVLIRVPVDPEPRPGLWRLNFQSPDAKNDWTYRIRVRVT